MRSIRIEVPDAVYEVLARRADEHKQSLMEYVRDSLLEDVSRMTLDEVLDRAGSRAGGSVGVDEAGRNLL